MNFNDGQHLPRPGFRLHPAQHMWEYDVQKDSVRLLVLCHSAQESEQGPVLDYVITAPRKDMLSVKITHFSGRPQNGPAFELNTEKTGLVVDDLEDKLVVSNGKLSVEISKAENDFSMVYYYNGRRITRTEKKGLVYVTDADFEVKDRCDWGHFDLPHPEQASNRTYLRERLELDVGECIYGLGERFAPLIRNGQRVKIWNADAGSQSDLGYKNIPFYLSSRGYGVFVNSAEHVDYEVGSEDVRAVQFSVENETLEYIVIGADEPKEVLTKYTALTGRTPVPPAWSFGLWMSTSFHTDFDVDEILAIIDRMKRMNIPLSVFHFDARWMKDFHYVDFVWHKRYGDVREMMRRIHEKGVKVCCWMNPYVSQVSRLFKEGVEGGYFLKKKDGSVYQCDGWTGGMAIVDFTNPDASAWYTGRLTEILDMGVDTIKTDFGERIPTDVAWFDGSDPMKMHNYYTLLYNRAIYEAIRAKYGDRDTCIFGRSTTVGSQKFPVQWGGDNHSSYVSMAESLRGGLSFCQSGFGFWAHDISGFFDKATPDLYKRWTQFGLFSTHSRLHGNTSPRMPWYFDDEAGEVLSCFTRLKCSLMPYIFSNAVRVNLEGQPMMRAMMLDFPKDRTCLYLDRQYMFGDSILTAPIFNDRGEGEFYVPATEGEWTDLLTGKTYAGGRWYTETYDYFHLPVLVCPGSIIPVGREDGPVYDYADGTTYRVYALADGGTASFTVYDADANEACRLTVSRSGNTYTANMTGRDAAKSWKLAIMGTDIVAEGKETLTVTVG